jgi:hypothetical protein
MSVDCTALRMCVWSPSPSWRASAIGHYPMSQQGDESHAAPVPQMTGNNPFSRTRQVLHHLDVPIAPDCILEAFVSVPAVRGICPPQLHHHFSNPGLILLAPESPCGPMSVGGR